MDFERRTGAGSEERDLSGISLTKGKARFANGFSCESMTRIASYRSTLSTARAWAHWLKGLRVVPLCQLSHLVAYDRPVLSRMSDDV